MERITLRLGIGVYTNSHSLREGIRIYTTLVEDLAFGQGIYGEAVQQRSPGQTRRATASPSAALGWTIARLCACLDPDSGGLAARIGVEA